MEKCKLERLILDSLELKDEDFETLSRIYELEDSRIEQREMNVNYPHNHEKLISVKLHSQRWRFKDEKDFASYLKTKGFQDVDKIGYEKNCFTDYFFKKGNICAVFYDSSFPF